MPVRILKYYTAAQDIWRQESNGRRFVARCTSKAIAARIVRLLNEELAIRNQAPPSPSVDVFFGKRSCRQRRTPLS